MLIASDNIISSATGIQQGDPLGPLLFAMAIDGVARSIASPFNIWYLDDATLGGSIEAVAADLRRVIPALSLLGLEINSSNPLLLEERSFATEFPLHSPKCPCYLEQDFLNEIDITIKRCAELIYNVNFDDTGWRQAKFPLSFGGLGLRSAVDLALPAYLSSLSSSRELIDEILGGSSQCFSGSSFEQACSVWVQELLSIPLDIK
ncbi:unnamed protein product [Acanthosepion pharaonis]|uniref:Reverse transcriptase domain-containing protein n=1 Tax=Acanthosepion pharaonis TaxID=158019 RepID=A0A812CV73_ACAPH|nr:unnamed protein product [Sepia pharaonis]